MDELCLRGNIISKLFHFLGVITFTRFSVDDSRSRGVEFSFTANPKYSFALIAIPISRVFPNGNRSFEAEPH